MYTAILQCGSVLTYEAHSFLPSPGELVPCRRHGYCSVDGSSPRSAGGRGRFGRRAEPRTEPELVEWLRHHRVTTIHALRRQRFTLRMLAAVEADLGLEVDHTTGRVLVRAAIARRAIAEPGGGASPGVGDVISRPRPTSAGVPRG